MMGGYDGLSTVQGGRLSEKKPMAKVYPFLGRVGGALWILVCILSNPLLGGDGFEKTVFEHLDSRKGLSHDCVYNIIQDHVGFLWFATENGLNRYDGMNIKTFKNDFRDPLSLSENDINVMVEDRQGRIWIGTWGGGIDVFEENAGIFHHIEGPAEDGTIVSGTQILSMSRDLDGNIWAGTWESGIFRVNGEGVVRHYYSPGFQADRDKNAHIWNIVQDSGGRIWVAAQTGLFLLNKDDVLEAVLDHESWVRALYPDGKENIYFSTEKGISRLSPSKDGFEIQAIFRLPDPSMMLTEFCLDHQGILWAGTRRHGLIRLDPDSGSWSIENHDESRTGSLANNNIRAIMEDNSENLWIGTRGGGVDRLDLKPPKFESISIGDLELPSESIWAFLVDHRGDLWLGTDAGLCWIPSEGESEIFLPEPGGRGLSHEKIRALAEDSEGNLWIGTRGGGLNRLDSARRKFSHFRSDPDDEGSISSDDIASLLLTAQETLWIGTDDQGLDKMALPCGEIRHRFFQIESGGGSRISVIFPLSEALLLVGTDGGGAILLDIPSGTFSRIDNQSLSNSHVLSIARGPGEEVFLGTRGGLNILDADFRTLKVLTQDDGLPDNTIYSIIPDEVGRFWMTTNEGLVSFSPVGGRFRCYGVDDGLVSMGFNEGGAYRDANGRMYVGGPRGAGTFIPGELRDNPYPPRPLITGVSSMHHGERHMLPLESGELLRIPFKENSLMITWIGLEFTRPESIRYEYRMEGFDQDWIAAGPTRQRRYTNLEPGNYEFMLRACNSDGVWSEVVRSPGMRILRPFWRHPLVITGFVLLLGGFFFLVYRVLTRRIRRRNLELEDLTELRRVAEEKAKRYARELEHSTLFDTLTSLPNRALVSDRIRVLLRRCSRKPASGFAVLLLDLDEFRLINDSMGHRLGDELLCKLTGRLETIIRTDDTLGRLGGDEFVIILHGASSVNLLESFALRIHDCLREPFSLDEREVFMTTSVGMVLGCMRYDKPEELLRDADTALYRAKKLGRGRHVLFDPGMHLEASSILKLENDLRRGIEKGQFLLYFQPIIDLQRDRLVAFEALLRWDAPDHAGIRTPEDFLEHIRKAGLTRKIGSWVLDECCRQAARWKKEFDWEIGVAANLFVQQVLDPDLPRRMQERLRKYGCSSSSVHLEITEEVLIESPESAIEVLGKLRELGFGMNLDDFGSGFSSLSYLQRFPVNIVKLDRSFITTMLKDVNTTRIVEAVILLARALGKQTIAEGIESAEVAHRLLELGCDFGQGYYFSRPVPLAEADALLREAPPDWMGLPSGEK